MIRKRAENDVLMGFADNGNVTTCFMFSVLDAFHEDAMRPRRRLVELQNGAGPYIHDNRSRVAKYFLEECPPERQWLWFVDVDMKFPPDTLYRMLDAAEEYNCPIIGAAYWNQYGHSYRYLSWLIFIPDHGMVAVPQLPDDRTKPIAVNAVGMGCTLIHRDVLAAVAADYVNDPWDTFAADMMVHFEDGGFWIGRTPDDFDTEQLKDRPIKKIHRLGEDVTFCLRAKKAGFECYGLPSLEVEHFKPTFMTHGGWLDELAEESKQLANALS